MKQLLTPSEIWNAPKENVPLECDKVVHTERDGMNYEEVYFTGNVQGTSKTRVFGVVCSPLGKSDKAILLIKPVDERINTDELAFFVSQGYTVMQIDNYGKRPVGKYTIYPQCFDYCNCAATTARAVDSVFDTVWYQQMNNLIKAVEYLHTQEGVQKVSVITVGTGSELGIPLLAVDKTLYSGGVFLGSLLKKAEDKNKDKEEITLNEELDDRQDVQAWTMGMAPQSYLSLIERPVLILNSAYSANDLFEQYSQFERMNENCRFSVVPNTFDFVPLKTLKAALKWLFEPNANALQLTLAPTETELAVRIQSDVLCDCYYTRGNEFPSNWIKAETDAEKSAKLKLYAAKTVVQVFAVSNDALPVCSAVLKINANGQYKKEPLENLLFNGTMDSIFVANEKTWFGETTKLQKKSGPHKIKGIFGTHFSTFAIGDNKTGLDKVSVFSFDVFSEKAQTLKVTVSSNDSKAHTELTLDGYENWQRFTLASDSITGWISSENYRCVSFEAQEGVIISNVMAL